MGIKKGILETLAVGIFVVVIFAVAILGWDFVQQERIEASQKKQEARISHCTIVAIKKLHLNYSEGKFLCQTLLRRSSYAIQK